MKSKIAIAATVLTLSACASQPDESTLYYKDYDCDRLAMELNRVDRQIVALHDQLNKKTDDDVEIMPFWATPFSLEGGDGPVFLEREDEPEVKEYAHLKGEKKPLKRSPSITSAALPSSSLQRSRRRRRR